MTTMTTMMTTINKKKQKINITIMSALKSKPTTNIVDCPNFIPINIFIAIKHISNIIRIVLSLDYIFSGFDWSQTTENLQDQCNCEVLSGTEVTVAGLTTPSGADTGDIYVNT